MTKVLGKEVIKARRGVKRSRRGYNVFAKYFNYEPRFNGFYSRENLSSKERNALDFIIYWQRYNCVLWFFWNWIYSIRSIKQNQRWICHLIYI